MKYSILAALAVACSIALAGCQTTAIDSSIAKASDRLASRCADLKAAIIVVDLFAPEKQRAAVKQGETVLDTFCAKPPRTAADLAIALGETLKAQQAINAAKRG